MTTVTASDNIGGHIPTQLRLHHDIQRSLRATAAHREAQADLRDAEEWYRAERARHTVPVRGAATADTERALQQDWARERLRAELHQAQGRAATGVQSSPRSMGGMQQHLTNSVLTRQGLRLALLCWFFIVMLECSLSQ